MTQPTLYDWFIQTVRRHPRETAIEVQGQAVTYADLHQLAERVAAGLARDHGAIPRRVGVLAARSLATYAAYLAALRLEATVVPLNPGFPPRRNLAISAAAGLDLVVADASARRQRGQFASASEATLVDLTDDDWPRTYAHAATAALPRRRADPRAVAYLMFTSGSTGTPKGVPTRHGHVTPYLAHVIHRYELRPGCRVSNTFELTFDGSIFDLFATWASGATLVVQQRRDLLDPVRYVNERGVTHWYSVPRGVSLAKRLGALPAGSMPGLRWSLFSGEQLTLAQAGAWAAAAPNSTVENMYGPTELTVTCTNYRLPADRAAWPRTSNGTVPIGEVYRHLEHGLFDDSGTAGDDGELCVRGPQRFDGYLDPADNPGRFVTVTGARATPTTTGPITAEHWYRTGDRVRLEDGNLVHLGRLDHQVKVRGYRVELGEIETVLRRHPSVEDVAVLPVAASDGETDLVALYVGAAVADRDLAAFLRGTLPAYMLPRQFQSVAELPLNDNRKVDRGRLATMVQPLSADGP